MIERNSHQMIGALQKRWSRQYFLIRFLFAISLSAIAFIVARLVIPGQVTLTILIAIGFFSIAWLKKYRKITERDVAKVYNQEYPEMEESAELLLKPFNEMNALERLQLGKVKSAFSTLSTPRPLHKRLSVSLLIFLVICLTGFLFFIFMPAGHSTKVVDKSTATGETAPEKLLPAVSSVYLTITPPPYTRRKKRAQSQLNFEAEEGSLLDWRIRTSTPLDSLSFLINDTIKLNLKPFDTSREDWSGSMQLKRNGFYQLKIGNDLSELYKMELIKDGPPNIIIRSPQPYTEIELGKPKRVSLRASIFDDYGLANAFISATISSGSGENIKFSEKRLPVVANLSGDDTSYTLDRSLDLAAFGMQPGDELSFFINATDIQNQNARSDIYRVVLPDTSELMSFEGMVKGVSLLPEYFRSQRQIIIETEQLLKDKSILTVANFKDKSNNLGIDQKLLRLRYGKFLGEEFEVNIGEHPGAEHAEDEHVEQEKRNKAKKDELDKSSELIKEFTHEHDNAEDATYFDEETKKHLRGVLTEMWNSELRLRTFKPEDALPYEYKALLLLKELQQRSRVYVQKTAIKVSPVKEEKRLTGELNKIISPTSQKTNVQNDGAEEILRSVLPILEELKSKPVADALSNEILRGASAELRKRATEEPGKFLKALESMRNIMAMNAKKEKVADSDIRVAAKAISQLLPQQPPTPFPEKSGENGNLSDQYFRNLKKNKKVG